MNSFSCTGRLTADPRVIEKDGIRRAIFSLAVERNGGWNKKRTSVDFFDFVAWRASADYIAKNFSKGDLMAVIDAEAITRDYIDDNGNKHRKQEYVVNKVYCISKSRKSKGEEEKYSGEIIA